MACLRHYLENSGERDTSVNAYMMEGEARPEKLRSISAVLAGVIWNLDQKQAKRDQISVAQYRGRRQN